MVKKIWIPSWPSAHCCRCSRTVSLGARLVLPPASVFYRFRSKRARGYTCVLQQKSHSLHCPTTFKKKKKQGGGGGGGGLTAYHLRTGRITTCDSTIVTIFLVPVTGWKVYSMLRFLHQHPWVIARLTNDSAARCPWTIPIDQSEHSMVPLDDTKWPIRAQHGALGWYWN